MRQRIIGILVSGSGSNFQAIIDDIEAGNINASIAVVISDREGAFALERAKKHGIKGICIPRKGKSNKRLNDEMLCALEEHKVDMVVLAGFLSILNEEFVKRYTNAIINIHPSLIPSFCGAGYYGHNVHQAAVDCGVKLSGATIHFVDEGTDTGPIIMQECVNVYASDDADALAARVLKVEHRILPKAVALFAEGKIKVDGRKVFIENEGEK